MAKQEYRCSCVGQQRHRLGVTAQGLSDSPDRQGGHAVSWADKAKVQNRSSEN
jgi:hypothetical protein